MEENLRQMLMAQQWEIIKGHLKAYETMKITSNYFHVKEVKDDYIRTRDLIDEFISEMEGEDIG